MSRAAEKRQSCKLSIQSYGFLGVCVSRGKERMKDLRIFFFPFNRNLILTLLLTSKTFMANIVLFEI